MGTGRGTACACGLTQKLTCTGRSGGYELAEALVRPVSGAAPGSTLIPLRGSLIARSGIGPGCLHWLGRPVVDLDPDHFRLVADFDERFAAGPPSLVACERLVVEGDVEFGRDVVVRGAVTVEHEGDGQLRIEDGTVLQG